MDNIETNNKEVVETPVVEGQEEVKTYSEEEVARMLQVEADRRVSQALAKQQAKFKEQMAEAEKLRTMNEEQKAQYQLEQRIKEIEETIAEELSALEKSNTQESEYTKSIKDLCDKLIFKGFDILSKVYPEHGFYIKIPPKRHS